MREAIKDGVAAYMHTDTCRNARVRATSAFTLGHIQRIGRQFLAGQGQTEYEITAVQSIDGTRFEPTVMRVVLNNVHDHGNVDDTGAHAPMLTHVDPLEALPDCVREQIESYSHQRDHQHADTHHDH